MQSLIQDFAQEEANIMGQNFMRDQRQIQAHINEALSYKTLGTLVSHPANNIYTLLCWLDGRGFLMIYYSALIDYVVSCTQTLQAIIV